MDKKIFIPLNPPSKGGKYTYSCFDFKTINSLNKNSRSPTQLSFSVNESPSEVAVRDSFAGAKGQKHEAIRLSVPKETPCES
jgi:hypothetical protein